jgi:thymidylate synthase (FAD)
VELQPDFYLPDNAHCRKQIGKPGHYSYVPMDQLESNGVRNRLQWSYEEAYHMYEKLIKEGCAKEIARACLPVGIYSQMRWTCNARSLMAFLSLRNAPKALQEIKDYAQAMEDIFLEKMPVTAAAFIGCGRVAP